MLSQFSRTRAKAEKEYRQFVRWGIGRDSIWHDVKGQALLGEDDFVDGLADRLRKYKDIPEIPRSQRYATRPVLARIFPGPVVHLFQLFPFEERIESLEHYQMSDNRGQITDKR